MDLHAHSAEKSDDSEAPLAALATAAAAAGLDALCVTDHDSFWHRGALNGAARRAGLVLLGGCEINTDAGHLLVFGLDEYRFGYHHPDVLARAVEEARGALVLAHPYRRALPAGLDITPGDRRFEAALDLAVRNPLMPRVHAVEVANGRASAVENEFAVRLAARAGVPMVAASDAHDIATVGRHSTEFEQPIRNVGDLVRELRAGRMRPAAGQRRTGSIS